MIDLIKDEEFTFWLPMNISKSSDSEKDPKGRDRWIEGIASTDDTDLQQENVHQNGIDFSYFLDHGYYNNDHKPGFENKVGQPTECRITRDGLWTKGFLFHNHKVSNAIWELANALESSKSDRKLGFSIQGKVLRRAGKRIMKCWIQDIAITAAPINTNTWLDVVKSLYSIPTEMWDDSKNVIISPHQVSPVYKSNRCICCSSETCKSLAIDESKMDLIKDNDKDEDEEKALSTNSPSGRAITPQSLESKLTDLDYGGVSKSLTFQQCVDFLTEHRNLSVSDANAVAETVFEMNGISN